MMMREGRGIKGRKGVFASAICKSFRRHCAIHERDGHQTDWQTDGETQHDDDDDDDVDPEIDRVDRLTMDGWSRVESTGQWKVESIDPVDRMSLQSSQSTFNTYEVNEICSVITHIKLSNNQSWSSLRIFAFVSGYYVTSLA